jgi:predicted nucleic acid-binding Zn ribbon protein
MKRRNYGKEARPVARIARGPEGEWVGSAKRLRANVGTCLNRRVPRYPARPGTAGRPLAMGDLLSGVVSRLGLERDLDDYRLWVAWDEIVGPAVARNAQPSRLRARRLVVTVKNATWLQELSLLRHDLSRKLTAWMGREVVAEIFLVVGKVEAADPKPGGRRPGPRAVPDAPRPADLNAAIERLWRALRERDQS